MSKELSVELQTKEYLSSQELFQAVAEALPSHVDPERFMRCVVTRFNKLPKLKASTKTSIKESVVGLAYLGLFPDGRNAHLIPYENRNAGTVECQFQVDYKGYVELAYRSGSVKSIHADVIYEGDEFIYELGQVRSHTPWAWRKDRPAKKGACLGAYCIVKMTDAEKHEVMDAEQLDAIRRRSQSGNSGPWVTDTDEMRKKTVFKRASKWIPIAPEIYQAIKQEDDAIEYRPSSPRAIAIESLVPKAIEHMPEASVIEVAEPITEDVVGGNL
jgi:recombination protein RecT